MSRGSATVEASIVMSLIIIIIFSFMNLALDMKEKTTENFEEKLEYYEKESGDKTLNIPDLMRIYQLFEEKDNGD